MTAPVRSDAPSPATDTDGYELSVHGMTCQHCVARVEAAIRAVPGVKSVEVQLDSGRALVQGAKPHQVIAAIEAAGYQASPAPQAPDACPVGPAAQPATAQPPPDSYRVEIEGMSCASCVARVERAIHAVESVS